MSSQIAIFTLNNSTLCWQVVIAGSDSVGRTPYMRPRLPGQRLPEDDLWSATDGASVATATANTARVNAILVAVLGVLAGLVLVALSLLVALVMIRNRRLTFQDKSKHLT